MGDPVRVGVFGAGVMGSHHARIIRSTPGVALTAVVDHHSERARRAAGDCGATISDRIEDVLGIIDLAVVALPTERHADVVIRLAAAGCHLLVEKPVAPTVDAAMSVVEAAGRAGVVLAVGHVERFNPAFDAVLRTTRRPTEVIAMRSGPAHTRIADGVVMDLMIHDLDLLAAVAQPGADLLEVSGFAGRGVACARLLLSDGLRASLRVTLGGSVRSRWFQVTDADGHLVADLVGATADRFGWDHGPVHRLAVSPGDALRRQLLDVVEAIGTGRPPRVGGHDGVRAVAWAHAVGQSLEGRADDSVSARMECLW